MSSYKYRYVDGPKQMDPDSKPATFTAPVTDRPPIRIVTSECEYWLLDVEPDEDGVYSYTHDYELAITPRHDRPEDPGVSHMPGYRKPTETVELPACPACDNQGFILVRKGDSVKDGLVSMDCECRGE